MKLAIRACLIEAMMLLFLGATVINALILTLFIAG